MSMPKENSLPAGLYEALLDEELQSLIDANPDLIPTLVAIDDEASPHSYSQFIGQVIKQALRITNTPNGNICWSALSHYSEKLRVISKPNL